MARDAQAPAGHVQLVNGARGDRAGSGCDRRPDPWPRSPLPCSLLCARLRCSNIDGASASCSENDGWCEDHHVDYVMGLAKNDRLKSEIAEAMTQAEAEFNATGTPARVFKDFRYRTRHSWTLERRVVGKAEFLEKGANPRFVVTSLSPERLGARALYEDFYCARGDMENRIKEQQGSVRRPDQRGNDARQSTTGCICPPPPTCSCTPCVGTEADRSLSVRRFA